MEVVKSGTEWPVLNIDLALTSVAEWPAIQITCKMRLMAELPAESVHDLLFIWPDTKLIINLKITSRTPGDLGNIFYTLHNKDIY